MPAAIARCPASSGPAEVLPAPVAAMTIPRAPRAAAASTSAPSMPTVAVMRKTGSAASAVATCRRPTRCRLTMTRPLATSPSGPRFGLWNVVSDEACVFVTSSAAWMEPARSTTTPWSRSAGEMAARTASVRLAGPS